MDRLYRYLKSKTTGAVLTDKYVVGRPVTAAASEADVFMPETPAKSGIYATAGQVAHETYRIIVDGTDSLDETTVEPGRVKVRDQSGNFLYPLLDKLVDAKLYLKALLADNVNVIPDATFRTAILTATASDGLRRTLVMDQDATLAVATVVSQDLHIDLNSRVLHLSANLTSSTSRIVIMNGKIDVTGAFSIYGTTTEFINCEITGLGVDQFVRLSTQSFTGCSGLTSLTGADTDNVSTAAIAGGNHLFGHAGKLRLTTKGSKSGSGRLIALQNFIEETLSDTVRMGILAWLFGNKSALAEWVDINPATRQIIANASYVPSDDGNVLWYQFQQKQFYDEYYNSNQTWMANEPNVYAARGINPGCRVTLSANGAITSVRMVAFATAIGNSATAFKIGACTDSDLDSSIEPVFKFLTGTTTLNTYNVETRRLVINAYRVDVSGGIASLARLGVKAGENSGTSLTMIPASGSTPTRLQVNGIKNCGATDTVASGVVVFEIVCSLSSNGAFEPVIHGA